jgi:chromosomal replication initiation ATPase DnaA
MSRLDDLLTLRRQIEIEIERERSAAVRIKALSAAVLHVTTRGTWNERVIAATCHHFAVDVDRVRGGHRDRNTVDARHTAMWLIRDAGRSYPEIGAELGMDHTSAISGVRRVEKTERLLATAYTIRRSLTGEEAVA